MQNILTEEGINRKFRIPYIISSIILLVSAVLMGYGYTNVPTQVPQSNNIQYQVYTSAEQKTTDLRNYQYSSGEFKIGMCGLGCFIVSCIMFVIFGWKNRESLEKFYELEAQKKRQDSVVRNLASQSQSQSQDPKPLMVTEPKRDTVHTLTVQKPQVPNPLQVQRQQPQKQQQQGKYIPYRGHLPPEYRNYSSGAKVYPYP